MADKTIDAIPAAGALSASDLIMVLQTGIEARSTNLAALRTWLASLPLAGGTLSGSLTAQSLLVANGAYAFSEVLSAGVQGHFAANSGGAVELRSISNHPLIFMTNNGERMRLLTTGNLALGGITAPELLTAVRSQNAVTRIAVDNQDAGTSARTAFRLGAVGGNWDIITGSSAGFGNQLRFSSNGSEFLILTPAGALLPGTDNTQPLGSGSLRMSTIFAGTGTINTSDQHEKTALRKLNAKERAAAKDLAKEIGVFQWLDAVERKGEDGARLHVGIIAQRVEAIFNAHGLDPWRYGMLCRDAITKRVKRTAIRPVQKTELRTVTEETIEIVDGVPTLVSRTHEVQEPVFEDRIVIGVDGKPVMVERKVERVTDVVGPDGFPAKFVEVVIEPRLYPVPLMIDEEYEQEIDEPAGDRLGVREGQVLSFILAGMTA